MEKNKIIWLTGQSESGKTSLAYGLRKEFNAVVLDGDEMRESISLNTGFSRQDRMEHNLRVARLAKILSKQTNVIVSVIAPTVEIRNEVDKICNPKWIYLKKTLEKREGHFYEEPKNYSLMVDNDTISLDKSVELIKIFLNKENI